MNKLSPTYRKVVEQCLQNFLKSDSISPEQYHIVDNFCITVPAVYRKYKSSQKDVERHHNKYFEKPLVYMVDGAETHIQKDYIPAK